MVTDNMSLLDKFIYKLFIATLLLTIIVCLDLLSIVKVKNIQNKLNHHFNILKVIDTINGEINIIPIEIDKDYQVNSEVINSEVIDGKLKVKSNSVNCYYPGLVVKITKDENFSVHILGDNGYLYIYEGLNSHNCKIYQYIKGEESFGDCNEYTLSIYYKGKQIAFEK